MVWVRRVRTASGATAIQIAESVDGRRRIVRHVGSARDEAELGLLVEEARRLLADDAQGELDLGITPKAAKAEMVPPPAGTLFADAAGERPTRQLVRRPQVLKTSSGLLYGALAEVYASLGFDVVDDEVFRDLVIARVVEPTSLLDADRVLAELGRTSPSLSTRKRTLRRARTGGYRDQIAAHRTPQAIAVTAGDISLSYRQLEHRANRLARYLLRAGAAPGAAVGLLMPRSAEFIVCALATLKTGAHYVPLSADLPASRTYTMLHDNEIQIVLTDSTVQGRNALAVEHLILLDNEQPRIDRESSAPLGFSADPERIAYVIYTSGSTGRPKGVAIAHRGILGLAHPTYLDFQLGERFLLHTSLLFDVSMFELWVPLLNGATVVVADPSELSLAQLVGTIERYNVSTAFFTTSLFNRLVRLKFDAIGQLRNLLFGGEAAAPTIVSQAATQWPHPRLINGYGPTECTVFTTFHTVTTGHDQQVPLGKPTTGRYIRILTDDLQLAPVGSIGELCVGGTCLAFGYVNRPELTATAFVCDPFSGEPDARLYRTGDLVVQTPDGRLLFQGRKDAQLKIRGFRVEPAEIEHVLRRHPQIDDVVVVKHVADEQLAAYLTQARTTAVDASELRAFLSQHLPNYMIPSRFTTIDQIPLTASGKTDRAALSEMTASEIQIQYHPPHQRRSDLEDELTEIWQRILGTQVISADADFFLLGGHSLQILELLETLVRTYRVALPLEDFLENPTIAALHATITAQTAQRV